MTDQPSEMLETENAAYVWVKECRRELITELNKNRDLTDDKNWQSVAWCQERLRRAIGRYLTAHEKRLESQGK